MHLVSLKLRKILVCIFAIAFIGVYSSESTHYAFGADDSAKPSSQVDEKAVKAQKPKAVPGKVIPNPLQKKKDHLSMVRDDAWLKDPFKNIQTDVKSVIKDFDQGKTKQPVKTTQPRIITRLDRLITMLEKSCKSGGGAAGSNPTRAANSSTLAKGPGGQGKMKAPDKKGRNWADLTPKQREKILQSRTEGFPPGYEDILADYFRRLARNQAVNQNKSDSNKQK